MKFKHKNGGICEVKTADAINRLKNNSDYKEICEKDNAKPIKAKNPVTVKEK